MLKFILIVFWRVLLCVRNTSQPDHYKYQVLLLHSLLTNFKVLLFFVLCLPFLSHARFYDDVYFNFN